MRLSALAIASLLVVSACALRPRYNDFITANTKGPDERFVVIDTDTNKPVEGAKIEISENKNRLQATTGRDGQFTLPVDKKYVSENPIFVVSLPKGVTSYRVELAPKVIPVVEPVAAPDASEAKPVAPQVVDAPQQQSPGTLVEVNDGGVPLTK
ncbi:MAG: hypothetical protein ACO1OB_32140 [Archangium sp.]